MKAAKPLLLFALLISYTSRGQDSLPPAFEIRDSAVTTISDRYWQMLENKNGRFGFPAITHTPGFHANTSKMEGMGFDGVKDYWVRWRMKNLTGKDQEMVFSSNNGNFKRDYYVIPDSGTVKHTRTGWGFPLSERDTFKTRMGVLINIPAGKTVMIYARVRLFSNGFYNEYNLSFDYKDNFLAKNYIGEKLYRGDTRAAFIAGVLVLGFFLNLFFYRVAKEKAYLYYALVLLLEGIWFLSTGTRLLFKEAPVVGFWFDKFFTFGLFFLCVTQFVRHFLKTFTYYPKWDRVIVFLGVTTVIFNMAQEYWNMHLSYSWRGIPYLMFAILFTGWMVSLLSSFFFARKESGMLTTLAIVGAVPVFCIWSFVYGIDFISDVVSSRTGRPRPAWIEWMDAYDNVIEMFCIAWFAFCFTWILTQQYALLRKQLIQQALAGEKEKNEMMARQQLLLEEQVQKRTAELKQSLDDLKNTQQQLIHVEKMASLGELTAGIAHEIQNPLNFVNNFSELNTELIAELNEAIQKGDLGEVKQIAATLNENEQKINLHGKRADSIVKGMLQHSRSGSGQKEPVNINHLVDECFRLSFHGMRAKDKGFNAKTEMILDETVPQINIVSQEISRVLLNLFTNAFYSVMQKKKTAGEEYRPVVSAQTKRENGSVRIVIGDNGNGIPQKVIDKIFQPFFTTKPTGEGTGLGLSMSYDIITKGHNGELQVETKEGEFARFIIILPV